MPRAHVDWELAFWGYVREDASGCWLWTGSLSEGYGQFGSRSYGCRKGKATRAHRIAYELVVGRVPAGLELDHLCRVRACCNPAHLEPVTKAENQRRGKLATAVLCVRGHALDGINATTGRRFCTTCARDATARRRSTPEYRAANAARAREARAA